MVTVVSVYLDVDRGSSQMGPLSYGTCEDVSHKYKAGQDTSLHTPHTPIAAATLPAMTAYNTEDRVR